MTGKSHSSYCRAPTELEELLRKAAAYKMTPQEAREQRISFVFGMLPSSSTLTKDDVRRLLEEMGL